MSLTTFLLMNLALAIFYAIYRIFLQGETHFGWARAYLVSAIIATFALPLLIFPESVSNTIGNAAFKLPAVEIGGGTTAASSINYMTLTIVFYCLVALALLLRSSIRVLRLNQFVKQAVPLPELGNRVYESPIGGSFSFFGRIYLEPGLDKEDQLSILNHELVHLREKHAIDLFFAELTKAIFWINPVAWFYGKRLAEVHEFAADQVVTEQLANKLEYQELLVAKAMGINRKELVHSFINQSMLKRRIMMINKPSSSVWSKFRYALFIPVLGGMIALASCQKNEGESATSTISTKNSEVPNPPAPPSPSDPTLAGVEEMDIVQRGEGVPENYTQPEFPGGMDKLYEFMGANLKYPENLKDAGVEGNVYTGFTVNADGSISDIKILKGVDRALDAEAIRVLKQMPKWKPGKKDGKAVAVEMTLPINFKLPEGE
ncbi:M56 family metallopeptidase [Halocola ammonii]